MGSEKGGKEAMTSVSGPRSSNDGNGAEETSSPDMLKNTPSNIRRLAHEIEQFEGRHMYLAQTTSPSDGGDVRWYFCKTHLAENGKGKNYWEEDNINEEMPACRQMFNIFHPFDPVVYRLKCSLSVNQETRMAWMSDQKMF